MSEANVWRSLERETGIEPATNSLEGCDSTTELLPPARRTSWRLFGASAGQARRANLFSPLAEATLNWPANRSSEEAKVGGEGRVRTSVALRRQVYSLLRLTALPPPRNLLIVVCGGP